MQNQQMVRRVECLTALQVSVQYLGGHVTLGRAPE
jgi:hypothetical protein